MAYNSKKIKYLREKVKGVKQTEMAKFLGLERGTYASKESKGDFTPTQFAVILKKLSITEDYFNSFQVPGTTHVEASAPEMLIRMEAKIDVTLSAIGELLAKQNGQSVTGAVNELTRAVKERYDQKINELLKSGG